MTLLHMLKLSVYIITILLQCMVKAQKFSIINSDIIQLLICVR